MNASKDPAITFREPTDEFFLKQDNFSPIPKISPLKLEASFVQNILNLPDTRPFDPLSCTSSIVHRDSNLQRYASPHPFSEVRRSESQNPFPPNSLQTKYSNLKKKFKSYQRKTKHQIRDLETQLSKLKAERQKDLVPLTTRVKELEKDKRHLEVLLDQLKPNFAASLAKAEQTPEFRSRVTEDSDPIQSLYQETGTNNEQDLKFEVRSMKQRLLQAEKAMQLTDRLGGLVMELHPGREFPKAKEIWRWV